MGGRGRRGLSSFEVRRGGKVIFHVRGATGLLLKCSHLDIDYVQASNISIVTVGEGDSLRPERLAECAYQKQRYYALGGSVPMSFSDRAYISFHLIS